MMLGCWGGCDATRLAAGLGAWTFLGFTDLLYVVKQLFRTSSQRFTAPKEEELVPVVLEMLKTVRWRMRTAAEQLSPLLEDQSQP